MVSVWQKNITQSYIHVLGVVLRNYEVNTRSPARRIKRAKGLIIGFISKRQADAMLLDRVIGTFLLRFSDDLLGEQST